MSKPTKSKPTTTGIVCPSCNERMAYHYTRHYVGYTQRSRRCLRCGVQVITREAIVIVVRAD